MGAGSGDRCRAASRLERDADKGEPTYTRSAVEIDSGTPHFRRSTQALIKSAQASRRVIALPGATLAMAMRTQDRF